jgi:RNA polymerase sigma-70 factor, ECF subfamily
MPDPDSSDLTRLLDRVSAGDAAAADELFPLVYHELRALAGSFFRQQPSDHTLQPTALVHDAYLRLVDQTHPGWKDRAHFFAVAAKAMRQILTDHARRKHAAKRGGGGARQRITLDDDVAVTADRPIDLLSLDEAMGRLSQLDPRKGQVVELRFFGGLTNEDVANVLGVSRATVADDWTIARAWLRSELSKGERN